MVNGKTISFTQVTSEEIGFMKALIKQGKNGKEIYQLMQDEGFQIGYSTVTLWIKKIKTGIIKRKRGSGRKRAIGTETKTKMISTVDQNRRITAKDLFRNTEINHNNVSKTTIQRMLNAEGFRARIAQRKYAISKKNKKKRLAWTKRHRNWTQND